jgi:chromosome segregation ATPase
MKTRGLLVDEGATTPDIYVRVAHLEDDIRRLRDELAAQQAVAAKAQQTWDTFRKERDFHRMHHQRVVQEKNRLVSEIKRLKKLYESYEPTLKETRDRYDLAMKEKMLMRLERDRIAAKVAGLESQVRVFFACACLFVTMVVSLPLSPSAAAAAVAG